MKFMKQFLICAMTVLLVASLSACGGSGSKGMAMAEGGMLNDAVSIQQNYNDYYGYDSESAAYTEDTGTSEDVSVSTGRKLVTTVSIDAETMDYDVSVSDLVSKVSFYGGYAENSDVYSYNEYDRRCLFILRIPKTALDDFLAYVNDTFNVTRSSTQERDVTLEYVDAESYKGALTVERDRLLELLEQAENLEDVLSIEDRLTSVRYQLENYERTLRAFDDQVEYSTVTLSIEEVVVLSEPEPEGWLERASKGIAEDFHAVIVFIQELGLFIVVHIPSLVMLCIVVFIIVVIVLVATKKSRARAKAMCESIRRQRETTYPAAVINSGSEESVNGNE